MIPPAVKQQFREICVRCDAKTKRRSCVLWHGLWRSIDVANTSNRRNAFLRHGLKFLDTDEVEMRTLIGELIKV